VSEAEPETLAEAHSALWRVWPAEDASPAQWRDFHAHSARMYARVAEVDARHRHEAVAWADAERAAVQRLDHQISRQSPATKERKVS
jgi:hypothetical protein